MNNELRQKLEVIISPRLLLEKLPVSPYGVAFVAWAVYNSIGQEITEEELRLVVEAFIQEHRFCIRIVEQLIRFAQVGDQNSFRVLSLELNTHPECFRILEQMFPKEKNI
jgi:hypothetical protein